MSTFVHRGPVASAPAACGFFDEPAAGSYAPDFEAGPVDPIAAHAAFSHYAEADDVAPFNAVAPSPGAPRNIKIPPLDHIVNPPPHPALRPDDPRAPKHDDAPAFTLPTPKWLPKKARPPKMHVDGRKDQKKQPPANAHPPGGNDNLERERQRSDIPGDPKGPISTPPIPVPLP